MIKFYVECGWRMSFWLVSSLPTCCLCHLLPLSLQKGYLLTNHFFIPSFDYFFFLQLVKLAFSFLGWWKFRKNLGHPTGVIFQPLFRERGWLVHTPICCSHCPWFLNPYLLIMKRKKKEEEEKKKKRGVWAKWWRVERKTETVGCYSCWKKKLNWSRQWET